jgi:hypothetical protein
MKIATDATSLLSQIATEERQMHYRKVESEVTAKALGNWQDG